MRQECNLQTGPSRSLAGEVCAWGIGCPMTCDHPWWQAQYLRAMVAANIFDEVPKRDSPPMANSAATKAWDTASPNA
jgi:hypothetical protein